MANIDAVKNALLSVMTNVGHFRALKKTPPYCVWAEDGSNGFQSENLTDEQALSGTIDLFTLKENDPLIPAIQGALNRYGISWYLNTVQFEDDTRYIHYEWVWEIG